MGQPQNCHQYGKSPHSLQCFAYAYIPSSSSSSGNISISSSPCNNVSSSCQVSTDPRSKTLIQRNAKKTFLGFSRPTPPKCTMQCLRSSQPTQALSPQACGHWTTSRTMTGDRQPIKRA